MGISVLLLSSCTHGESYRKGEPVGNEFYRANNPSIENAAQNNTIALHDMAYCSFKLHVGPPPNDTDILSPPPLPFQ